MLPRYVKDNFSKGIVSPSVQAQVGSEEYQQGIKDAENCIVLPGGGITNRPGTKYIDAPKNSNYGDDPVYLHSFVYGDDIYILEFGNLYIRFYKDDALLGGPYEVVTPYTSSEIFDLNFVQSGNVLYITHVNHQPRTLTRSGDTSWALATLDYIAGPYMPINVDSSETITPSATTGNITLTAVSNIFSNITGAGHAAGRTLWQLNEVIPANHTQATITATATSSSSLKCGGTWRIITHGTWTGKLDVEISSDGGSTWKKVRYFSSAGTGSNFDTFGTEDPGFYYVRVTSSGTWTGTAIVDLSTDAFIWSGIVRITQVPAGGGGLSQMYNTADATVVEELASATATNDWAEGSWSAFRGYPRAVAFYQDRLCFAGNVSEPQTTWMSETGYYESFRRHAPLLDSDGISVSLPGRSVNDIKHLVALNHLLVLTDSGEWTIFASENKIITPTTVQTKNHGYTGSSTAHPVIIKNRAIYVDKAKSGLRDTGYNFEADGFEGADISDDASQLFDDHTITQIAYQRKPFPIVWCVRDDGILLSLTYSKERQALGWSRHSIASQSTGSVIHGNQKIVSSRVYSICTVPRVGYDELWLMCDSDFGSHEILKMEGRVLSDKSDEQYFLDKGNSESVPTITLDKLPIANYVAGNGGYGFHTESNHGLLNGTKVKISGCHVSVDHVPGQKYYEVYEAEFSSDLDKFKVYEGGTTNPVDLSEAFDYYLVDQAAYCREGFVHKVTTTLTFPIYRAATGISIVCDGYALPGIYFFAFPFNVPDQFAFAKISYGVIYHSLVELLPPVIGLNTGLMAGINYSIPEMIVRLYNSIGGKIGYDVNTLVPLLDDSDEVEFGKNTIEGTLVPKALLTTGDSSNSTENITNTNNSLIYKQEEPYPFILMLVVMFLDVGGE